MSDVFLVLFKLFDWGLNKICLDIVDRVSNIVIKCLKKL